MKDFPDTHLIYFVDASMPSKPVSQIINYFPSHIAAIRVLDVLCREHRAAGAYLINDELRVKHGDKVVKRWMILPIERKGELNLK